MLFWDLVTILEGGGAVEMFIVFGEFCGCWINIYEENSKWVMEYEWYLKDYYIIKEKRKR